ncbi:MAG: tRNA pseudouridine(38-40) synthase TruA [Flavobacteriales bacterium]|nr:MAG: tRNA pseudouridine(38-40) synthase TruA [Flavobacteriales bacterium]
MAHWTKFYLIRIEFLGFRFHGWQVQPGLKSVEGMINKTFNFILEHDNFKVLGCGRTDAKVSADDFAFELFLNEDINSSLLLKQLNDNLPFDIRTKSVEEINADFNIIQHSKVKEYHYHFSYGEKSHPFNAPFIINFGKDLNIELMQKAVKEFVGVHNFKRYATKPTENTNFEREIVSATIEKSNRFKDQHNPEDSYVFKVSSKGFLRYQVRLMMAALIDVGNGTYTIEDIKNSLINFNEEPMKHNAPSSGLNLHKVTF